jgi:phage FluMu protein Com
MWAGFARRGMLPVWCAYLLSLLLPQAWFTPKCKEIQEFQHKQELRKKQRRAQKAVRNGRAFARVEKH